MKKRHNNTPPIYSVPPKVARHNTNIIEPTENDQFLRDTEQQELTDQCAEHPSWSWVVSDAVYTTTTTTHQQQQQQH